MSDEPTVEQLLAKAASVEGNMCHVCDTTAHYFVQLGQRGRFACVEHVQLVIEDVVQWVTGVKLMIEPARLHEQAAKKKAVK
jgi:hypothetical protein